MKKFIITTGCLLVIVGCSNQESPQETVAVNLKTVELKNKTAYIPPMCYTKTEDNEGNVYNPCYSCHTPSQEPNYVNDGAIQILYSFASYALTNHWSNLFKDNTKAVAEISDTEIDTYIQTSNYFNNKGEIILAKKLKSLPEAWDLFNDRHWYGYIPDCYFSFDEQGFDKTPQGEYSGWRAFLYTPFLGTFWPTNGSIDDVMIRLSSPFQNDENDHFDLETYKANLAIVEALIQQKDTMISPLDEKHLQYDLDKNGELSMASKVTYIKGEMHFVGYAGVLQDQGEVHAESGLFPVGTEFLHSVRYLDSQEDGSVTLAPHMKELRYGIKRYWKSPIDLALQAERELQEKNDYPDQLRQFDGNIQSGLDNKQGWAYSGFIEDKKGELRPQSYEETLYCIGCHSGIGATTDGVFSFPRKINTALFFQKGWAHLSQNIPDKVMEPKRQDGSYEYTYYLMQNHAGDEFRENQEVKENFFDAEGKLNERMLDKLHLDIGTLTTPSKERARLMNKAYRNIVKTQSFIYGRDVNIEPVKNVHAFVEQNQPTGIEEIIDAQR